MKSLSFIAVLFLLVSIVFLGDLTSPKSPITEAGGGVGASCTTSAGTQGTYQQIDGCFDIPNRLGAYCSQWVENGANRVTRGCKSGYDRNLCQTDKDMAHQACSPKVYNVCNTSMSTSQCSSAGKNGYLCQWGQLQCTANQTQTTQTRTGACTFYNEQTGLNQSGTYGPGNGFCEVAAGSQVATNISNNCLTYGEHSCGLYYFCHWNTGPTTKCLPNTTTQTQAQPRVGDSCNNGTGHLENITTNVEKCSDNTQNLSATCSSATKYTTPAQGQTWVQYASGCKLSMCIFQNGSCSYLTNNSPCPNRFSRSDCEVRQNGYGDLQLCNWGTSQETRLTCVNNPLSITGMRATASIYPNFSITFSDNTTVNFTDPSKKIYVIRKNDGAIKITLSIETSNTNKTIVVNGQTQTAPDSILYLENGYVHSSVLGTTSGFTYDAKNKLDYDTEYYITADPAMVSRKDNPNDSSPAISANQFSFKTPPPPDITAPTLSSFTPTTNATDTSNVNIKPSLIATFSENIKLGTGNVIIKKLSDNSTIQTIAPTAANISISGAIATITPTANLNYDTRYYVVITNDAFKDIAGNSYAGLTTNNWQFTTKKDTEPPTLITFTPTTNATNIPINTSIILNFSEPITKGTGNITITKSDNSAVQTINLSNFTVNGMTATANLTNLPSSTSLRVNIPAGAFIDLASPANTFTGTAWSFITAADTSPITFTSLNPANNSVNNTINTPITITFNRKVSSLAGKIIITKDTTFDWSYISRNYNSLKTSGLIIKEISVSNSATPSTTFSFSTSIPAGSRMRVIIPPNTFKDLVSGISFSGILNAWPNTWSFSTGLCIGETQSTCTTGANMYRGCVWLNNSCQKATQCNQLTQYSCEGDNNVVVTNPSTGIRQCYLDNSKNPRTCSPNRPPVCENRTPNPIICDGDNQCILNVDPNTGAGTQCKSKPAPQCSSTNQTTCEADPSCEWDSTGFVASCKYKKMTSSSSFAPPPPPGL